MEWIHWQLCGIIIIGALISDITSAIDIQLNGTFGNFSLYSFTSQGDSWQRAYDACYSEGLQLAMLDEQDQDLLYQWDGTSKDNGDQAWIAGRRLEDSGWMWVNGDRHTGTAFSEDTHRRCGIIQGGLLQSARCVIQRDGETRRALCQRQSGQRRSYSLTSDNFTSFSSWFAARMECRSQPGRDLAHVRSCHRDEDFLRVPYIANITAEDRTRGVWVGVCQNCWTWVTGNQISHQPMDYFHFARDQGSGDGEDCLHLNLWGDQLLHWSDVACNSHSKYFVCEQRNNTEDNSNSDPQTTPNTVVGCPSSTPEVLSGQVLLPAILVTSVVVVVLVIVVTVLVIRRRKGAKSGHKEHETSSPPDISPYAEISSDVTKPCSTGAHGDSATTNDVTDYDNTRSSVGEGHTRGPGGDVYAIPATLKQKDRKSDHLEMQDNTTYGGW